MSGNESDKPGDTKKNDQLYRWIAISGLCVISILLLLFVFFFFFIYVPWRLTWPDVVVFATLMIGIVTIVVTALLTLTRKNSDE